MGTSIFTKKQPLFDTFFNSKKKLWYVLGYVALAYLAYTYLSHGLGAISFNTSFISRVIGLGFTLFAAKIILIIVGITDILIAISLFAYRKKFIVIYSAVWPFVPAIVTYINSGSFNLVYLHYTLVALLVYWIFFRVLTVRYDVPDKLSGRIK